MLRFMCRPSPSATWRPYGLMMYLELDLSCRISWTYCKDLQLFLSTYLKATGMYTMNLDLPTHLVNLQF